MVIVVGVCIIFIVVAGLLSRIGLTTGSLSSNFFTNYNPSQGIESKTNPLLDFGNNSGLGESLGEDSRSNSISNTVGTSPYAGSIYLSTGNVYSIQPLEEYMVIRNAGGKSVSITGWTLTNGKGGRPVQQSNNSYFYPTPDTAIIGQGTEFLDPSGKFTVGSIVLEAGDTAYVMTGGPFSQFPFSISTSFRDNVCTGYIEHYPFSPQLTQSCPSLVTDPEIRTVTDECYDYIDSLDTCSNPEKNDKKVYDKQPSHCKAFISARVGYSACVRENVNTPGFSKKYWRVFLGKSREMWASQRETITLYDSKGLIVDQVTY